MYMLCVATPMVDSAAIAVIVHTVLGTEGVGGGGGGTPSSMDKCTDSYTNKTQ